MTLKSDGEKKTLPRLRITRWMWCCFFVLRILFRFSGIRTLGQRDSPEILGNELISTHKMGPGPIVIDEVLYNPLQLAENKQTKVSVGL